MGYLISKLARADRFDYPHTAVYYEPGSQDIGIRLARQLGVGTATLPPGNHPRTLVVIVGPRTGPGTSRRAASAAPPASPSAAAASARRPPAGRTAAG